MPSLEQLPLKAWQEFLAKIPPGTRILSWLIQLDAYLRNLNERDPFTFDNGGRVVQTNPTTTFLEESDVTNTELSYVEGVTSGIQSQLDAKPDLSDNNVWTGTNTFNNTVTLAALTEGSVPYIGASGVVTEDNTHFQWDATNDTLQLGESADEKTITISGTEYKSHLKVNETDNANLAMLQLHRHSVTDTLGSTLIASRSNSAGSGHGVVTNGQNLLRIAAAGWTDDDYDIAAQITFDVDGTAGANDIPGRIVFWTTPDGSNVSLEALRIKNDQNILVATNNQLQLRDTAIGMYSQADTFLDLFADGGVRIGSAGAGTDLYVDTVNQRVGIGDADPDTKLEVAGAITVQELSSDPSDPAEGKAVFWKGDGGGTGDDGDLLYMEQSGGVVATGSLKHKDLIPSSITVNTGTVTGGTGVADAQVMFDGNLLTIDEVTGVPGFDVEFVFSGVDRVPSFVVARWNYNGSATHYITIDIWNYNSSAWDQLRVFRDAASYFDSLTMYIPRASNSDYVSGGAAKLRMYHHTTGNASHDISIDYMGFTHSLQGVL